MGRLDWASRADDVAVLPVRTMTFSPWACRFLGWGLTLQNLVVLSAGHTLGFAGGRPMNGNPQQFLGYGGRRLLLLLRWRRLGGMPHRLA